MSEIPIREKIRNAVEDIGGQVTNAQIIDWIEKKYGNVKQNTIANQIMACTVNRVSRTNMPECQKPRHFDNRYDFLYQTQRGVVELYDPKRHGVWELIDHEGKTLVAKDGVPQISDNNESPLLTFLKQKTLYRNYVPIILKALLEKGNDSGFVVSIDEIKKNIGELNFGREDYHFNDALRSAKGALNGFVTFSDTTASFHLDKLNSSDIPECLKICGQKIALYHVHELTKNNFEMSHILPGRRESNFKYLNEFIKTNSIGIGWNDVGDVSNLSESELKQEFVKQYPSGEGFSSFLSFMSIKPKDIVVLTKGQEKIIDFGIVVGDYEFKDASDSSYAHRKNIVWLNQGPISAQELSGTKLLGFIETVAVVYKKRKMLIETLLGKGTVAAIQAHSCFILSSYDDSEFADILGKEYEYPKGQANSKSLNSGSKFIVQSKIDGKNYFVGYGKIDSIQESEKTNSKGKPLHVAKYQNYEKIDPPKLRTEEINNMMKSMPEYGSQPPSILPISRILYKKITGDDLGEPGEVVNMSEIQEIVNVLIKKKNVILYGPPGTGKTFTTDQIRTLWKNKVKSNPNSESLEKSLLFSTDEGKEKIEKFQKFIADNGKILWGVGWYPKQLEESDYPITGYIKLKGKVIAITNIIQISKSEDTPKNDLQYTPDGGGEGSYLYIDKLELCTPFPFENLNLFGKPNTTPNSQKFSYVDKLTGISHEQIDNVKFVTFHPSYSYEDFVEGIRPVVKKSDDSENSGDVKIAYALEDGIFKKICDSADKDDANDYLLIIDEINRGNVSKIFGELITLIEDDKRDTYSLDLAYSKKSFTVPKNLYILGTMNTADKSLIQIDTALRRRFAFVELPPNYDLPELGLKIDVMIKDKIVKKSLKELLEKLNEILRSKQLRDKQIGHSYFLKIKKIEDLQFVFQYEIIPLLQDYFYDNYEKLADVLGEKLISKTKMSVNKDVITDSTKFSSALGQIFNKQ